MLFPGRDPAVALRGLFQNDIFVAWQRNGMVCVNPPLRRRLQLSSKRQTSCLGEIDKRDNCR
jgi:hypothetical protein